MNKNDDMYYVGISGIVRSTQKAILELVPVQSIETPKFIEAMYKNLTNEIL